jgi:hypothetical protein
MSESAFGVEHGEVSKAFSMPTGKVSAMGGNLKRLGQQSMTGAQKKPGAPAGGARKAFQSTMGQKAKSFAGAAGNSAKGFAGTTTGKAVIGGGAVGLTGGVYANRKKGA